MNNIDALLKKYEGVPDERFFGEVFGGEYKAALDVKADVVIDVGATAGEFSAYIYDNAKVIYALEPYSEHYKELEENIQMFGLTKIKPFRLALSDVNDVSTMTIHGVRGGNTLMNGQEPVQTMTLATFMKQNNIDHVDVLKIDVEGGEGRILNAPDFKDVESKISFIIGEHLGSHTNLLTGYGFRVNKDTKNFTFTR